jgi:glucosamine--fructose-6-phosphate aminotransferase (isomerizing)
VGDRQAAEVLLSGLARLEYRGYDSAGVAILHDHGHDHNHDHDVDADDDAGNGNSNSNGNGALTLRKSVGKLAALREALDAEPLSGSVGIGHTRWATHGRPTVANAHPHRDCSGDLALVHNGIIENYASLREELRREGHSFLSDTDTEVIAHLIETYWNEQDTKQPTGSEYVQTSQPGLRLAAAVAAAMRRLKGAYAIAVMHRDEPGTIVAARKDSPLIVGLGQDENFVASDIPAVLEYTREVVILHDDELAILSADGVTVLNTCLEEQEPELLHVAWSLEAAEKGGYEDFMLKEIHEQPTALRETLRGRLVDGVVQLSELELDDAEIAGLNQVFIIACGTSYHAGRIAEIVMEVWARIPTEVQASSEFRYADPIIDEHTLVVAITQSGETADTLAGVREARARGAKVMAITNVVGSRVTREADGVIYTHAGPEIGVAATKTFTSQIAALNILALKLAQSKGTLEQRVIEDIYDELSSLPELVANQLLHQDEIQACASGDCCINACTSLFLGRGIGVPVAMEGALKLKEISYIHAEAYPAGEMKHGPIALISPEVPVIGIATNAATYEKVISNIEEVRARDAQVMLVGTEGNEELRHYAEHVFYVPEVSELLSPIVATVPLQLLAYYIAKARGCNVDQPRNLAKSVTVE